jgi:hypothetical protein
MIELLRVFNKNQLSDESLQFINSSDSNTTTDEHINSNFRIYSSNIKIYLETVHAVKGETHCATLYLETSFHKSCESERLINQLLGNQINNRVGKRIKQSARIAYVGFSRPTHFLCLAIHNDRLSGHKEHLRAAGWEIDETLIQSN